MILVDTSIWVEHLRSGNPILASVLDGGGVLAHPWVVGELALGNVSNCEGVIGLLLALPQAILARDEEVLGLIEQESLYGAGIGYVDAQLLAATRLTADATLWTKDRRLLAVSDRLGLTFHPPAR